MRSLGTVKALFRYPVKSMAGERLDEVDLGWYGVDGDRRFAFRREQDPSGFPWLTAGKLPTLVTYQPVAGKQVITPGGETLALDGEPLRMELSALHGSEVRVMHLRQGVFDEAPLSLISTATIDALSEAAGRPLDIRRFRPNILIETETPFLEDSWVGKIVSFGTARMAVTNKDLRCGMINFDPDSAETDPVILKAVVRTRDNWAGIYGSVLQRGRTALGDAIYVAES